MKKDIQKSKTGAAAMAKATAGRNRTFKDKKDYSRKMSKQFINKTKKIIYLNEDIEDINSINDFGV